MPSPLNRVATTPDAILRAIIDLMVLNGETSGLNASTIFVANDPGQKVPQTGSVYVALSLLNGALREGEYAGGGVASFFVDAQLEADFHVITQLDPIGQNLVRYTDLVSRCRDFLKVLAGQTWPFDLLDGDGNGILVEPLEMLDFSVPPAGEAKGQASVAFKCSFEWDLTS